MRFARPASRGAIVAVASLGAFAVIGGTVVAITHSGGDTTAAVGAAHADIPAASLSVAGSKHGRVPYDRPIRVKVQNGALQTVTLKRADGALVSGEYNNTRTRWRSASALGPQVKLTGQVSYADLDHHVTTQPLAVRTANSKHHLSALLSPGDHSKVGVGSPIVVSFNYPVPQKLRAAVEHRLSVTTSPQVVGAWHWMSDQEVHWRPPAYWKPGTEVTLTSNLEGLRVTRELWGAKGQHSTTFTIGPSHISIANVATHEMTVYQNHKLIRTVPISAGRSEYPTKGGVHITFEKSPQIVMDSATVGIPPGSPGYYRETVYWDVRISYGGAFVHAAPWSVGDQGNTNVSHGCINVSPSNAEWFYNWAQRGDIVDVINSTAPDTSDPGMADWNMSWKQWLKGDADPSPQARALHPPMPRAGEPGFGPPKHHQHHHGHHRH